MSHRCLADFLEDLGHDGELARIETRVDPMLEAAEVTRQAGGDTALLFGSIAQSDLPLLTNLLGSRRRICRALNAETLDEVAGRIAAPTQPEGWFGTITTSPDVAPPATAKPRNVKTGPCQQILNLGSDVDLRRLPLITSASLETAPSITAAVLLTAESTRLVRDVLVVITSE